MGKRKRNRSKSEINADDPPPNLDTGSPSSGDPLADLASRRNWADLLEPLLISTVERLSSAADHVAFASACNSWRSAASSTSRRGPPLLLVPATFCGFYHNTYIPLAGPAEFRFQTLTLAKSYRSLISSSTLGRRCIGCSHAHLIFISGGPSVVLADAFTGREVSSPAFPARSFHFSFGILTSPLSSPSCLVLVVALDNESMVYSVLCWRPGSDSWSELKLYLYLEIVSLVAFKGQVFGVDSLCRTMVVEFEPHMSCRLLGAELSYFAGICGKYGHHLFECDEELHMVVFVPSSEHFLNGSPKIEVYALDMSKSMWVKKESLGNWCVFIDVIGKCAFACSNPIAWGGRRNCVYLAGPGFDPWSVFPVNGEPIDMDEDSPLNSKYLILPKWPSPVWVYPGLCSDPARVVTPAFPVIPPAIPPPVVNTEASTAGGSTRA